MRRVTLLLGIIAVLFATACGNAGTDSENNSNTDEPIVDEEQNTTGDVGENANVEGDSAEKSDQTEMAKNQEDMKKMMEQLDFYEIEVEVSYGPDKEFEFEIEHHSNGDIEAKVEDELNNVSLKDDIEAFNYIFPNVKKLKITEDISKQEAIDELLKAFDLATDYKKIEIEFEFENGTIIAFEDKK